MLKIEKGIPIPAARVRISELSETLIKMDIGDSFSIPINRKTSISASLSQFKRRNKKFFGKIFTMRDQKDGTVRVWRME